MEPDSKVALNKRVLYLCVFLILSLPVIVGVLVWHFTQMNCDDRMNNVLPTAEANIGGKQTTKSPETTTRPPSPR